MGEMVADEMTSEIERAFAAGAVSKITLVGHSLGGLVFRAALPHLKQFKEFFYSYIALGTPHLGYFHSNNKLLSLGIWVVGGVRGTPALKEISLSDSKAIEDTTLYDLSKGKGLDWFNSVILVGSTQDCYSPIESAIIQMSERLENSKIYKGLKKMQRSLTKKLRKCEVHRINVNYLMAEGSIDTYIGRKAHIQFIDNHELIKMIMFRYSHIFDD